MSSAHWVPAGIQSEQQQSCGTLSSSLKCLWGSLWCCLRGSVHSPLLSLVQKTAHVFPALQKESPSANYWHERPARAKKETRGREWGGGGKGSCVLRCSQPVRTLTQGLSWGHQHQAQACSLWRKEEILENYEYMWREGRAHIAARASGAGRCSQAKPMVAGLPCKAVCPPHTSIREPGPVSEKAEAISATTSTFLAVGENTQSLMFLRNPSSIDAP